MDTQCDSKTLRGFLAVTFCIFKQIGCHVFMMSCARKSGIFATAWRCAGRCPVKTPLL